MRKIIFLLGILLLTGCGHKEVKNETFPHSFVETIEVENIEVEEIHVNGITFENSAK